MLLLPDDDFEPSHEEDEEGWLLDDFLANMQRPQFAEPLPILEELDDIDNYVEPNVSN